MISTNEFKAIYGMTTTEYISMRIGQLKLILVNGSMTEDELKPVREKIQMAQMMFHYGANSIHHHILRNVI